MVNIFSGIISSGMKTLFSDMISALLYDDAFTLDCTIYYGITKYEDCPNCVASSSSIGGMPSTSFQNGGPMPFPFGTICPMCNGNTKRGVETTESISLMVIFDHKQFVNVGTVNHPEGTIQTITFDENTPQLKRAKEITVANPIDNFGTLRYERMSDPQPCGLGNTDFIECLWKRI